MEVLADVAGARTGGTRGSATASGAAGRPLRVRVAAGASRSLGDCTGVRRATVRARASARRSSWSSASAAIQPDISTIGMPGPGCAAPPARYRPVTSGRAVRRLERPEPLAVARQAVDRAVQHAVAVVDVLRRQRRLEDDAALRCPASARSSSACSRITRRYSGSICRPVVVRPQVRRVDQDVQRLAARRGGRRARCGPVAAR